ncbi:hypothetical protein GQX73_g5538 [Xylaria multiplex]|uniref:Rhodopsin domain-containing protein n=1 Tax=Xylaria multiplex TaxID=323545 RepID=A0A7C8MQJ8_9PEZI|nr:hypothetical protein GQX73_g5538 [Xylaria multiplex]
MSALDSSDVVSVMAGSRGSALLAVSVTTMVIALLTCILRYCVRSRISQTIGWEDYFVGGAMFIGIVGVSFAVVESVSQENPQNALQFDYLAQPWLSVGSALSKASIYLLVRRLVAKDRFWRTVLVVQMALLLLVNLAYVFTTLLQCRPLEKLWKPDISGDCWSLGIQQNIGYFQGAFDVLTQLFITLFPIMILQDLEIPRNVRWPFHLLATISAIVTMFGVLRTYNISLIQLNERQTFDVIKTILAVIRKYPPNLVTFLQEHSANKPGAQRFHKFKGNRHFFNLIKEVSKESSESLSVVHEAAVAEAWPQGIIKTVSVEVVEEDVANIRQDASRGESRSASRQQDWDAYLP